MLSLVGDSAGERVVEILGEELTGSLIENRGGDLREEDELLQLRMDEWKVAVNPQVQSAAEARPLGGLEWCPEWRLPMTTNHLEKKLRIIGGCQRRRWLGRNWGRKIGLCL